MLGINDLKPGVVFIFEGQPYELIEASLMFKGRGSSVLQAKIKNLINVGFMVFKKSIFPYHKKCRGFSIYCADSFMAECPCP